MIHFLKKTMAHLPQFIRKFSQEHFSHERKNVANRVREKRASFFKKKKDYEAALEVIDRRITERAEGMQLLIREIDVIQNRLDTLSNSWILRSLHPLEIERHRADIRLARSAHEELFAQQVSDLRERDERSAFLQSEDFFSELREAEKILEQFAQDQKEKWIQGDYSREEISHHFTEEYLASLSFDEYILLLRRFPQPMVTHVTRQGVRDHIGHSFHRAGYGEFFHGFQRMIADGRLRSPLGVYMAQEEKDRALSEFLRLDTFSSAEDARRALDSFVAKGGSEGGFADRSAIHFAAEEVADAYYGSERGNEIFVIFPSAHIASQYYFQGDLRTGGGGYWNDKWVWAHEERGMDIQAGIVFIPRSARVDSQTGSRYALDETRSPIVNDEYINLAKDFIASPLFSSFSEEAQRITGSLPIRWWESDGNFTLETISKIQKLEPLRFILRERFSFHDERLQNVFFDYHFLQSIQIALRDAPDDFSDVVIRALQDRGIFYQEAQDTVSSQEYWEGFFAQFPDKRPRKIVYYDGTSPTRALQSWREANGILKKTDDGALGFSERHISATSPQASSGMDRFYDLALHAIDWHFPPFF